MRPEDYVKAALECGADSTRLIEVLAEIVDRGEAIVMVATAVRELSQQGIDVDRRRWEIFEEDDDE